MPEIERGLWPNNFLLPEGIPRHQHNANLSESLTIRVGIPHRGGKLALGALNEGYATMVSANAFFNAKRGQFVVPECTDLSDLDWALDSAGFTAVKLWQSKGAQPGMAGIYPWSYQAYIELAAMLKPSWWSAPDLCCETAVAGNKDEVSFRIRATTTLLEGTLRVIYAWQNEMAREMSESAIRNMIFPPVPVIQGWEVDDYLRSYDQIREVWSRWEPWIAPPVLMGVGSVCRRHLTDSKHGLYPILDALDRHIDHGTSLHLFGVKGESLKRVKMMHRIASVDSMAYDYGARVKARIAKQSNTIAHRTAEMNRWMQAALKKASPCAGDQYLLKFA